MTIQTRKIVLVGELLGKRDGRKISETVYEENDYVYSKVIGIPKIDENEINVIPLNYTYIPKVNDKIIGIIKEVETTGWIVDINSPYFAFLPLGEAVSEFVDILRTDISKYYEKDEIIFCKVIKVTEDKVINVSMKDTEARKLNKGIVIRTSPSKVPRIIGKGGSMINLLKSKTNCEIIVGQNGYIFVSGEKSQKVLEAINIIERESHFFGLTDKIKEFLENG